MEPEVLEIVKSVFNETVDQLPSKFCTQEHKTVLASRILSLAAAGERDRVRLRSSVHHLQVRG